MRLIAEYIKLTKKERQTHLNLTEECTERGGNSTQFKGMLAVYLDTYIPHGRKDGIYLCHACNNDKCSNLNHLYWGTPKENHDDGIASGRIKPPPFNIDHLRSIGFKDSKSAAESARKGNLGKPKTAEHKRKISETLRNRKAGVVELVDTNHSK